MKIGACTGRAVSAATAMDQDEAVRERSMFGQGAASLFGLVARAGRLARALLAAPLLVALPLALASPAAAFSTSEGTNLANSKSAGTCTLLAQTFFYESTSHFYIRIYISDYVDYFHLFADALYSDASSSNDAWSHTTSESAIENACGVLNVSELTVSIDSSTYSGLRRMVVTFEGDEDGVRYAWTAFIGGESSSSVPDPVVVTKKALVSNSAPTITSNGGGDTAAVNAAENQTAVTDVQATDDSDSEGSGLTYSISGGADSDRFDIVGTTGVLTFKVAPDFETPTDAGANNVYDVQVTVTDSGSLTDIQDIAVTVTDEDEYVAPTNGTVTVIKRTSPSVAGDGTFTFSSSATELNGLSITTAGNTGSSATTVVTTGSITLTEDAQATWGLADISCTGDDNPAYDVANRTVTIDLDADEAVICTFTNSRDSAYVTEQTQEVVAQFMNDRAHLILLSQPDLVRRLTQNGGDIDAPLAYFRGNDLDNFSLGFAANLKPISNAALSQADRLAPTGTDDPQSPFNVWINGKWAHADTGPSDTDFAALHLGLDYMLDADLVIGVLGQLDWTGQADAVAGSSATGLGWMVGPYVVARLHDNVIFDASVLGGQSYNQVSPTGLYIDDFVTDRLLAKAQLTGDFEIGDLSIMPFVSGSYFIENQHSYVDGLSNVIPAQTIALGNIQFGPRASYVIDSEGLEIEPSVGVIGNLDYAVDGSGGGTTTSMSGKVEGGVDLRFDGGASFNANAFYGGLGITSQSYGASGGLRVPLN
jgi:hypothetical protein